MLQIPYTNLYELGIGLATLLTALLMRRISKKIPHLLVAILVGSALAAILGGAERGIRFVQEMPSRLPPLMRRN